MNLFELQDFLKTSNPNKSINYEFDEKCQRTREISMTDGIPNLLHHVECNKVKVTVEGEPSIYFPIAPHRLNYTWVAMKNLINSSTDVYIPDLELKSLVQDQEISQERYQAHLNELSLISGLTVQQIEAKVIAYKNSQP